MSSLFDLVSAFRGRRVLVIGEAMLDSYLSGAADHLSREAPVPIVTVASRHEAPGGAANAAANIRSLGGEVRFASVIGDDHAGEQLRAALARADVSDRHLIGSPDRRTLAKQRILAEGQMLLRFDEGSPEPISRAVERQFAERIVELHAWSEAILVSDYGYGILTDRIIDLLAELQRSRPRPLVVDAKHPRRHRKVGPTAVKPNYAEAVSLLREQTLGSVADRAEQVARHGRRLLELCNARWAAVTLDSDGALLIDREAPPYRTYARPTSNDRASGAGDTFAAAFTLALAAGSDGATATEAGSAASAVAVGKEGTATCSADELWQYLVGGQPPLVDAEAVARHVAFARSQGQRIVFTNGCFDILHRGHVAYLNRAKALGDLLVVGLNSDESVRRLKGAGRPINSLEDRAQVLAALSCVDLIVPFDDATPAELIRLLRPDVYAKGADYTLDRLPEATLVRELGGEVQLLPLIEDRSTTRIIERIGASRGAPSVAVAAVAEPAR